MPELKQSVNNLNMNKLHAKFRNTSYTTVYIILVE